MARAGTPVFLGVNMEKNSSEKSYERFSEALREMIEECYCLGGASLEEVRLAHCDFLTDMVNAILVGVPDNTTCPPRR